MNIEKFISLDFPNGEIVINQFQKLLQDKGELLGFLSLTIRGDQITISLANNDNMQEKIEIIDAIIANFAPDLSYNITDFQEIEIYPTDNKVFLQNWKYLTFFNFAGTLTCGIPNEIIIYGSLSSNTESGEVRIYDITNQVEICKVTVSTKYVKNHIVIPEYHLWPRNNAIIEIHAKQNSTSFAEYIICHLVRIR